MTDNRQRAPRHPAPRGIISQLQYHNTNRLTAEGPGCACIFNYNQYPTARPAAQFDGSRARSRAAGRARRRASRLYYSYVRLIRFIKRINNSVSRDRTVIKMSIETIAAAQRVRGAAATYSYKFVSPERGSRRVSGHGTPPSPAGRRCAHAGARSMLRSAAAAAFSADTRR